MSYTPAMIPTELHGTATAIFWTAANLLAVDTSTTDAIAEACAQVGHRDKAIRAATPATGGSPGKPQRSAARSTSGRSSLTSQRATRANTTTG